MSRRESRRSPLLLAMLLAMHLVVGCGNKQAARTEPQIQLKSTAQPDQDEQATTRVLVNGSNVTIHHHDGSITQLSNVDPEETLVVEAPGKVEVVNAQGTRTFDMANANAPEDPGAASDDDEEGEDGEASDATDPDTQGGEGGNGAKPSTSGPQEINSADELGGIPVDFEGGVPTADSVGNGNTGPSSSTSGATSDQDAGDSTGTGEIDQDGFEGQTRGDQELSQEGVGPT